jgi:BirA family transcriptional regulator, biotin operon repressor / biotin---[acetyl-CoA-carboxylase] ligase
VKPKKFLHAQQLLKRKQKLPLHSDARLMWPLHKIFLNMRPACRIRGNETRLVHGPVPCRFRNPQSAFSFAQVVEPSQNACSPMIDPCEIAILRHLRTETATVESLSKKIGISVDEVENLLESLRQSGFAFQRIGDEIGILSEPDWLVPQAIMARLDTTVIGRDILVFRETPSTNDLARQAGAGGAREGIVFFAQQQTAGRGTQGRQWISRANAGLWFSILLRSQLPLEQCPLLIQMAAIAAAETVELWSPKPVIIKPPNDLYLNGGKLGGILLETSNGWNFQVLGIGMNVRFAPHIEGYPTAALNQLIERPIPLAELAAELLKRFEAWYLQAPLEEVARTFAGRVS